MEKYILFCAQQANFQSRTMLIPYDKYLLCEKLIKDFDILRKHSKPMTFVIDHQNYEIDNLILSNIIWHGNSGINQETEYSKIINDLMIYADGWLNDEHTHYLRKCDKIWYDKTYTNLCQGFNHIKNYCML